MPQTNKARQQTEAHETTKDSKAHKCTAQQLRHELKQELYLDEGVIASGNNDIRAVFGIAYSIHIISMRPHSHSGLQAPQCVRLLQVQLKLAEDSSSHITDVATATKRHNLVCSTIWVAQGTITWKVQAVQGQFENQGSHSRHQVCDLIK